MSFNEIQLKALISEMFQTESTASGSILSLLSYARVYIALYRLLTLSPGRKDFGNRNEYTRKADLLFKIILERASHTADFTEKSRLLSALFSLNYGTASVSDAEKDNLCRTAVVSLMREYEKASQASDTDRIKENAQFQEDAIIGICRCLTDFYSPSPAEADEWFFLLKTVLAKWSESLSDNGSWKDVSDNIALERIEIMNRNSFLLLDSRYDEQIRCAYRYYRRHVLLRESTNLNGLTDLSVYGLLYEVAMEENVYGADHETAKEMIDRMIDCGDYSSLGNDERLYCLSYQIDHLCKEILEEAFNK